MESFSGYEEARKSVNLNFERVPVGAYVGEIKKAFPVKWEYGKPLDCTGKKVLPDYLAVWFDITEGEYKDHYANDYRAQTEDKKWRGEARVYVPKDDETEKDDWTKKTFARFTAAVEDSNQGYLWKWEEATLKGKKVGLLFQEEEYKKKDGTIGTTVKCRSFCSVDAVHEGKFKLPPKKVLKEQTNSAVTAESFFPEGDLSADELPFD